MTKATWCGIDDAEIFGGRAPDGCGVGARDFLATIKSAQLMVTIAILFPGATANTPQLSQMLRGDF